MKRIHWLLIVFYGLSLSAGIIGINIEFLKMFHINNSAVQMFGSYSKYLCLGVMIIIFSCGLRLFMEGRFNLLFPPFEDKQGETV